MDRAEKANDLVKEIGLASGDPEVENRACLAPAYFAKDARKDLAKAEALYEDCISRFPNDPFIVSQAMKFFDEVDKRERSTELIRGSVEAAPENLSLRATLANRLRNDGKREEAEKVLVEAAESFGTAAAWNLLVNFYRTERDSQKALGALEKVMELTGGGSDQLRFSHADVLVDLGELERAEEVAKSLNEPIYGKLISGRIQLAKGDAKGALESFEQGIRRWPNNAGARYLAGLAAYQLGDFERAISELRESARADMGGTEAAILLARLYYERGDDGSSVKFSNAYLNKPDRPQTAEAYQLGGRALTRMKEYEKARKAYTALGEIPGRRADSVAGIASVARAETGIDAAIRVVESSGLDLADPANEVALRSLAEDLVLAGRVSDALERTRAAAAAHPDSAGLQELHGAVLARAGRDAEARSAYEKALALDAESAAALGGLATLRAHGGDRAGAVEMFDRAADLAKSEPSYAYSAAQLVLASGDGEDAMRRLREIVRQAPGHAGARNDLAWLLADRGEDLDQALALAEEARRLDSSADVLDTLGWVHLKRGEAAAAVEVLEAAVEARADSPSIRYRLATALQQSGDSERAREMLRRALESGSFPEAEEARRQLAQLEHP
jgi:tetratricopeptide (TPR) repeat protein